jgi:hypothetical protein
MTKPMLTMMLNPPAPRPRLALHAARALGAASRLLDRLAARLDAPATRPALVGHAPMLEFHAEAGAPESALYFNGERIGTLPGVTRL